MSDGEPDQRYVDFYARRSSPALYCAIVGNVVIPGGHPSNSGTPTISRSQVWPKIARAISDRGTVPGIQLATAWEGYQGSRSFRGRDAVEAIDRARGLVSTWKPDQISYLFVGLEDGAIMALEAGFRHVQLHAAHGYLFNLLIDDRIYPGAEDVRGRVVEWLSRVRSAGAETSIRISLRTGDARFDSIGTARFQDQAAAMPTDYVDVSSGFYNIDKQLIYPARPDVLLARRRETLALAFRQPRTQFILSGRALLANDETLPDNVHIGLCRDLLANPDFLADPSKRCINSGKCHYFSRGTAHITCPQWERERG